MRDTDKMPFGAHKDKAMANVPAQYLLFIYDQDWIKNWQGVKDYIEDNMDVLKQQKTADELFKVRR